MSEEGPDVVGGGGRDAVDGGGDGEEGGYVPGRDGLGPEGDKRLLNIAEGYGANDGPQDRAEEVVEEVVQPVQEEQEEGESRVRHGHVKGQPLQLILGSRGIRIWVRLRRTRVPRLGTASGGRAEHLRPGEIRRGGGRVDSV